MPGVGCVELLCPLLGHFPPITPMCSLPRSLAIFKSFYNPNLQSPPPHPPISGGLGKFPLSNHMVSFLVTSPILKLAWDPTLSHLININSGMLKRSSLLITKGTPLPQDIPKVLGVLPGTRDKGQIYIFLLHHRNSGWNSDFKVSF